MMPKLICGVINLRGGVVPVVDLPALFGLFDEALSVDFYALENWPEL